MSRVMLHHLSIAVSNLPLSGAFYDAALAVGGQSNGAPGLRPHYGPHYYAAFLIDPDGHAIEAVINAAA